MNIPEGWKLVPVEPTEEMLQALDLNLTPLGNFKRMLAVAPTPPAQEDELRKAVIALLYRWDRRTYEDMEIEMEELRTAMGEE